MLPNFSREDFYISLPIRKHKGKWVPEFTRYWIKRNTELFKNISRLEAEGLIKKLEKEIAFSSELQKELMCMHQKEIEIRRKLLSHFPDTEEFARLKKIVYDENVGLGGIRNWKKIHSIKCLHLWTAYHIMEPENFTNFIGKFVLKKLGIF